MADFFDDEDEYEPPESAVEFLTDAIGGIMGDWAKTDYLEKMARIYELIEKHEFAEIDRMLAAVDADGPVILIVSQIRAAYPASHHLNEFMPLLERISGRFYTTPDQYLRDLER